MGFVLATLPFLRLAAGIRLPVTAQASPHTAGLPALAGSVPLAYTVLTLSKARSRRHARKNSAGTALGGSPLGGTPLGGTPPDNSSCAPLPPGAGMPPPTPDATPPAATALRIIQRSPHEQPECLFISGRMADVCAALERMEASDGCLNA